MDRNRMRYNEEQNRETERRGQNKAEPQRTQQNKGHNRTKDRIRIGCGSVGGAFASDTRDSRF